VVGLAGEDDFEPARCGDGGDQADALADRF